MNESSLGPSIQLTRPATSVPRSTSAQLRDKESAAQHDKARRHRHHSTVAHIPTRNPSHPAKSPGGGAVRLRTQNGQRRQDPPRVAHVGLLLRAAVEAAAVALPLAEPPPKYVRVHMVQRACTHARTRRRAPAALVRGCAREEGDSLARTHASPHTHRPHMGPAESATRLRAGHERHCGVAPTREPTPGHTHAHPSYMCLSSVHRQPQRPHTQVRPPHTQPRAQVAAAPRSKRTCDGQRAHATEHLPSVALRAGHAAKAAVKVAAAKDEGHREGHVHCVHSARGSGEHIHKPHAACVHTQVA
jgi:hypothetical protein